MLPMLSLRASSLAAIRKRCLLLVVSTSLLLAAGSGCGSTAPKSQQDAVRSSPPVTPAPQLRLQVTHPQNGLRMPNSRVTVRGTIDPPDASVRVLGETAVVRDGVFQRTVRLPIGNNAIDVIATRPHSKPATASVSVIRTHKPASRPPPKPASATSPSSEPSGAAATPSSPDGTCDDSTGPNFCFSGNGKKSMGTLVITVPSVVHWKSGSPDFEFDGYNDNGSPIGISSRATSGTSIVDPGTYQMVYASTIGNDESWIVTITPR